MRRKLKKAICLLSCTFLFAMPFCFMASAETVFTINPSTTSFSAIGHYNQSAGSVALVPLSYTYTINGGNTGKEKNLVFTPASSAYSSIHGVDLDWKFSEQLRFFAGDTVTMTFTTRYCTNVARSNYTANQTVSIMFGNDLHCEAKPVSYRYSTMSTWTTYKAVFSYDECGGGVDSIAVFLEINNAYPKIEMTLDEVTVSSVNTVDRVVDGMHDTIIGNVDPANPPQYSPPAANDAIGNLDALQSQLDNAKKSWNPMIFDLTGFGNAFAGLRLAFDSIVGSFGSDFGVVLKVSIIFGCVSLLVGLVINASVSSIEYEQRQARENAHERERNSYKQYKLNRSLKESHAALYAKEKNAWKRGNK